MSTNKDALLISKLRNWQERAKESQRKYLCINCNAKPVAQSRAAQEASLCQKCSANCQKEQCYYCQSDFVFLDAFRPWMKVTRVTSCIECIEMKHLWGTPQYCQICTLQCAYSSKICRRCTKGTELYGDPVRCEDCQVKCAFMTNKDNWSSTEKTLCHICSNRVQKKTALASDEVVAPPEKVECQQLSKFATDEDAMDHFRELERKWRECEKLMRDKKANIKALSEAEMDAEPSHPVIKELHKLQQKVGVLKSRLQKRKLDEVQLLSRVATLDKRFLVDEESETVRQSQMQHSLERSRMVLIIETSRLEAENAVVSKQLFAMDKWPPPWHAEDKELEAENKRRKQIDDEVRGQGEEDNFLDEVRLDDVPLEVQMDDDDLSDGGIDNDFLDDGTFFDEVPDTNYGTPDEAY